MSFAIAPAGGRDVGIFAFFGGAPMARAIERRRVADWHSHCDGQLWTREHELGLDVTRGAASHSQSRGALDLNFVRMPPEASPGVYDMHAHGRGPATCPATPEAVDPFFNAYASLHPQSPDACTA